MVALGDIFFIGYYPVISFLGYVLVGMALGRANLKRFTTGVGLLVTGAVMYVVCRGVAAWLLTDDAFTYRVAHATGVRVDELGALAATGASIDTTLLMGTPQWYGLAVPQYGAPIDLYSTASAAIAENGLNSRLNRSAIKHDVLIQVTDSGEP